MAETNGPDERGVEGSVEDDTEGQSLSVVMGLGSMASSRERSRDTKAKAADDELPPLTKPFPRLKDDARK